MRVIRLATLLMFAMLSTATAADYTWVSEETREGLKPVDTIKLDEVLVRAGTNFSQYRSVHITAVEFPLSKRIPANKPRVSELPSSDRKSLTRSLRIAFEDRFDTDVPVIDKPVAGTLTIEIGITEVLPNRDIIGIVVNRPGQRPDPNNRRSTGVGKVTIEAVFTDAATGEVVAVALNSYEGPNLASNLNARTRWGDVRTGFRLFVRQISLLFN